MAKKFNLLMAAVAVLAFAVPAMASAAPSVTSKAGTLAPVGTIITGTSTNTELSTNLGTLKCEKLIVKGKITENSGSSVKVTKEGEGTTSGCKVGTEALTWTDLTLLNITSTVDKSGTVGLHFVMDLPGDVTCTYEGAAVPFTYTSGSDTITISGNLKPTPAACGAEAKTKFTGSYTLTIGSTPVILD